MRFGRLVATAGILAASLGVVIGIQANVAGACPVANNDGTVWGSDAFVLPISYDEPGLPGDSDGIAHNESLETIYVDDRDFTGTGDDTLGPGQSPTEATLGQNINLVDSKSGDEEGFWLYAESNTMAELQRGGKHVIFEPVGPVPDEMDKIIEDEIEILPPGEPTGLFPEGLYLFQDDPETPEDESGFPSGGSLSQTVGEKDPCNETDQDPNTPAPPVGDSILF